MNAQLRDKRRRADEKWRGQPEMEFVDYNQSEGDTITIEHYLTSHDKMMSRKKGAGFDELYTPWAEDMKRKTDKILALWQAGMTANNLTDVNVSLETDPRFNNADVQRLVLRSKDGSPIGSTQKAEFDKALHNFHRQTYHEQLNFKVFNVDHSLWRPMVFEYHPNQDWLTASEASDVERYATRYHDYARDIIAPGRPTTLAFAHSGAGTHAGKIDESGRLTINLDESSFYKTGPGGTKSVNAAQVRNTMAHELAHRRTGVNYGHGAVFHKNLGKNVQNKALGRLTAQGSWTGKRDYIRNTEDDIETEEE